MGPESDRGAILATFLLIIVAIVAVIDGHWHRLVSWLSLAGSLSHCTGTDDSTMRCGPMAPADYLQWEETSAGTDAGTLWDGTPRQLGAGR